jgi:hypothetical protein
LTSRIITGLYDNYEMATKTVHDLEAAGIASSDISIVAHRPDDEDVATHSSRGVVIGADSGAATGAAIGGGVGLLTGLGMLAIPGVGPVVAAGWLVATGVGAVIGAAAGGATGSLIGLLTSAGVTKEHAHVYAEAVRRGGSLVTAKVDDAHLSTAEAIMQRNGRVDPVTREKAYRDGGWREFDETLAPFSADDVARERALHTTHVSV